MQTAGAAHCGWFFFLSTHGCSMWHRQLAVERCSRLAGCFLEECQFSQRRNIPKQTKPSSLSNISPSQHSSKSSTNFTSPSHSSEAIRHDKGVFHKSAVGATTPLRAWLTTDHREKLKLFAAIFLHLPRFSQSLTTQTIDPTPRNRRATREKALGVNGTSCARPRYVAPASVKILTTSSWPFFRASSNGVVPAKDSAFPNISSNVYSI